MLNYILRHAQDLQPFGFRAMYLLKVLLIFTGINRLKFFDVLQVFVFFHGIGKIKLVFSTAVFALFSGI